MTPFAANTGLAVDAGPEHDGREPPGSDAPGISTWPVASEALQILDQAEERARQGDWQGFGEALEELRVLLETQRRPGG